MKSKVQALANKKGINTPQELSYAARITWPTAKSVWGEVDLAKTHSGTLLKIAHALKCGIDDLYVFESDTQKAAI